MELSSAHFCFVSIDLYLVQILPIPLFWIVLTGRERGEEDAGCAALERTMSLTFSHTDFFAVTTCASVLHSWYDFFVELLLLFVDCCCLLLFKRYNAKTWRIPREAYRRHPFLLWYSERRITTRSFALPGCVPKPTTDTIWKKLSGSAQKVC